MKHTISVLVENRFGVLAHIAGLFSARAYNIESLSVGETEDNTVSRMTIVTRGDDKIIEQVTKQLNKLIDVIKVVDLTRTNFVDRELLLVKVGLASNDKRSELLQLVDIFRAKVVDIGPNIMSIEITGDEGKILAFLEQLAPYGIREVVRTGKVAIARG